MHNQSACRASCMESCPSREVHTTTHTPLTQPLHCLLGQPVTSRRADANTTIANVYLHPLTQHAITTHTSIHEADGDAQPFKMPRHHCHGTPHFFDSTNRGSTVAHHPCCRQCCVMREQRSTCRGRVGELGNKLTRDKDRRKGESARVRLWRPYRRWSVCCPISA